MKVRTTDGWIGEVSRGATVTQIDVDAEESLLVEPGPGHRAIVLLVPLGDTT